LLKTPVQPLG